MSEPGHNPETSGVGRGPRPLPDLASGDRDASEALNQVDLWRQSLQMVGDGMFWMDRHGRMIEVNDAAVRSLGYSRAELLEMNVRAFAPRVDDKRWQYLWREILTNGSTHFAGVHKTKDGQTLHVEVQLHYLRSGDFEFACASVTDISVRKRLEQERDRLFATSLDMMCIADVDGYFKQLNPAWTTTLGWSLDELMARPYIDFVHPDDRQMTIDAASDLAEGRDVLFFRNRYQAKDGSYRLLSWNSTKLPEQQEVFAVARDETASREAELALRESESRFRTIADTTPLVIWTTDPDGLCTYVNRAWLTMTGQSLDEALQHGWMDAIHPEDRPQVMQQFAGAFEMLAPVELEFRVRPPEGEYRWLLSRGLPRFDGDGKLIGYAGSATDYTERRQAEMAMHVAHGRLQALISNLQAGILLEDENRRIVLANQMFCDMFNVPVAPEVLVGQDCAGHAESSAPLFANPEGFVKRVAQILRDREVVTAETLAMADGRTLERDYVPIYLGGSYLGHLWQYHDVTERKQAETALRRSEAEARKLSLVASRTDNAVIITDAKGRIEWVNDGFTRLTGWKASEVVGQKPGHVLQGPETDPDIVAHMRSHIGRGQGFQVEVLNYTKDSWPYWVSIEVQPVHDDDGQVTNFVAVESDITERKVVEQRMKRVSRLEEIARRVISSFLNNDDIDRSVDMMLLEIGRFLHVSRAHLLRFDRPQRRRMISTHEWCGLGVPRTGQQPRVDDEQHLIWLSEAVAGGRVLRLTAADSSTPEPLRRNLMQADVRSTLVLPVFAFGRLEALVVLDDVTGPRTWLDQEVAVLRTMTESLGRAIEHEMNEADRRRNAIQLREALNRAEQASQAKSEFLANMSHEIRTPMTAIIGYADLLGRDKQDPDDYVDWARQIQGNANHLLSLLSDVLDLSKIEADQLSVNMQPCNPVTILEEVLSLMKPRAQEKLIALEAAFKGQVPGQIRSDPVRLRQILINLVSNAIKFTDKGTVTVEMQVKIGKRPKKRELIFSVRDTGIGISAHQQRLLFQPFAQVHRPTHQRQRGTGLGLAISKRLAGMLGGDIRVDSALGKGSTFSLNLPLQSEGVDLVDAPDNLTTPEAKPTDAGPARADLAGKRILLVDDNPDNRRILRFLLQESGGDVLEAADGAECLDRVEAAEQQGQPLNVVLMDMQMPVMDGYDATRELRRRGVTTPIIALTAFAMSTDRERCINAGCDDYISKPIIPADFFDALCRNMPGLSMQAGTAPSLPATGFESPSASSPNLKITNSDRAFFRTTPPLRSASERGENLPAEQRREPSRELAGEDADFAALVEMYLRGMIESIRELKAAAASRDRERLAVLTHRIKGSAGSYGFPRITQAAGDAETMLRQNGHFEQIEAAVGHLIELMHEATQGL